ncbi:ANTAR domain-containing protein [Streptomyces sp. NPDC050658]|uniref:ANTAR domain-containing protein n=1 Tax=unclassified Streptomyces TaxID=2593676 RepID=UPI00343091C3
MAEFTVTDLMAPLGPEGPGPSPKWLQGCAALLGVDGVAVSLGKDITELVWFSDEMSARLDDLQFTVGEGPGIDAAQHGALCLVSDLEQDPGTRWPAFAPVALAEGTRAMFAFPLKLGTLRIGVLVGSRSSVGPIRKDQVAYGFAVSDALALFVLAHDDELNGGGSAQSGDLHRAVVYQATGVVSMQLLMPLHDALDRIRAYAFAHGRQITHVARDIVDGRLRLPGQ